MTLDATDRRIIEVTQAGLPLMASPFATVAAQVGIAESDLLARLESLKARGVIRVIVRKQNSV